MASTCVLHAVDVNRVQPVIPNESRCGKSLSSMFGLETNPVKWIHHTGCDVA